MARHVSYKIDGENRQIFKVHSSDASKTFWNDLESGLNFITITEDDFKKLKYSLPHKIDANNNLVFSAIPTDLSVSPDITQYTVEKNLNEHIQDAEHHLRSHVNPIITQTYIDALKSIDLNAITWPVTCQSRDSWVEALELNSHSLDSILEV